MNIKSVLGDKSNIELQGETSRRTAYSNVLELGNA